MPQAFYNKQAGIKRIATETGAGQWGTAMSFACNMFGLECTVYMVKVSYQQKPYRKSMMQVWGADVIASPSNLTDAGRAMLAKDPDNQGSLGLAISEAVEDAVKREDTHYALGSVLNHVCLHQTVIGLEAKEQLRMAGDYPDVVIGCHGGGSNFAGIGFPFVADKAAGKKVRILAVEPTSCPTLTKGVYAFDYGDTAKMAPVMKMYTLGHDFMPPGIHAGGLRYHGSSALVSQLLHARDHRGEGGRPDRLLRGGDPVRPDRGDHPGPRVVPRDPRRDRRGAARRSRRGRRRPSSSTSPATATSTCRPTTTTSRGSSRTTSTRSRR